MVHPGMNSVLAKKRLVVDDILHIQYAGQIQLDVFSGRKYLPSLPASEKGMGAQEKAPGSGVRRR